MGGGKQGSEGRLLGLLIFWGVVGRRRRLVRGHIDVVRVAWVVIGAGSCFGSLGFGCRSGGDVRAADRRFHGPGVGRWRGLHIAHGPVHHGRSWIELRWGWWIGVARRAGVHSIGDWRGKDIGPAGHVRVPIGSTGGCTSGGLRCHL